MATLAEGRAQSPVSSFQFTVRTIPNSHGLSFIPDGEVGFTQVSGLSDETENVTYKEGNDLYEKMLPGRSPSIMLTLRRGLDRNNRLLVWRNAVKERTALPDDSIKCDVIVTVWNRQGAPAAAEVPVEKIAVWKFKGCWPRALRLADLDSVNSEINIQEVELCTDGPPEQLFPSFGN